MILFNNAQVIVRPPYYNTDYFDIVTGFLLGDILAPYPFIICLDYVLRTSIDLLKENGLTLKRRYPVEMITNRDYADDLALLVNASTIQTGAGSKRHWPLSELR